MSSAFTLNVEGYKQIAGSLSIPDPQEVPSGWLVEEGDGQSPYVVLHDEFFEDRATYLNETNEIFPFRPVTNGVVSPNGKVIVDVEGPWFDWMVALNGQYSADHMLTDGDGFFDTESRYGMMVAATGGQLVNVLSSILQNGNKWYVIETHDYDFPPILGLDGVWRYQGQEQNFNSHPHLFTSRVNRRKTPIDVWQTWNGTDRIRILSVTDARKGAEHWGTPANKTVALQGLHVWPYPKLPFVCHYKADSWVVDGVLQNGPADHTMDIHALLFHGADTWGRNQYGDWIMLEQMLQTAQEGYASTALGWRCYASLDEQEPYMPRRACRVPFCDWTTGKE